MADYILSIDQGTTGTTVALVDSLGALRARVNHEFPQYYPRPGWVEHKPEEIWQSVLKGIQAILKMQLCKPKEIVAVGIANQRETAILWNKQTSEPLYNAIVWQCRRTADDCQALRQQGLEAVVKRKAGLLLDPYFTASKYRWLLDNAPAAKNLLKRGLLLAGTVESYLIWRLSGGVSHISDVSNASRTSLMNIRSGKWDKELMEMFSVPQSMLPSIVANSGLLAETRQVPGLPDGIAIAGVAGDQQAALFGQACFNKGEAKCTFGTGSFILMNTGDQLLRSKSGLLTTIAWQLQGDKKPTYALEGGAFVCGAAVQWLRDGLGIIDSADQIETLALEVESADGVEFVPALTGLGAPHWDAEARGLLSGLTRGTTRSHIARATLEAMALQNVEILRAMEADLGRIMKPLRVDGGAVVNNLLMQIQADYLGRKIIRPSLVETTVMGAAYLAGLGVGMWSSKGELRKIWQAEREFKVAMSPQRRQQRLSRWQKAVARATLS